MEKKWNTVTERVKELRRKTFFNGASIKTSSTHKACFVRLEIWRNLPFYKAFLFLRIETKKSY